MTRLLTVPFQAGRPKFSPAEENAVVEKVSQPLLQYTIHNAVRSLVVIGYIESAGDEAENKRAAFRRAQLVIDLLRDKCGLAASSQAVTLRLAELPKPEQTGRQRAVEVWVIDP